MICAKCLHVVVDAAVSKSVWQLRQTQGIEGGKGRREERCKICALYFQCHL